MCSVFICDFFLTRSMFESYAYRPMFPCLVNNSYHWLQDAGGKQWEINNDKINKNTLTIPPCKAKRQYLLTL